jgi:hypothetical protein
VDYRIDYNGRGQVIRLIVEEVQYKVGSVGLMRNLCRREVLGSLRSCLVGGTFTYDALRDAVADIQSFYFGRGYIFVQIKESTSLDTASGEVAITYAITENEVAYVDRIEIRGNMKTKDKVIRREMRIKPGERFDGDKLCAAKSGSITGSEEVTTTRSPGPRRPAQLVVCQGGQDRVVQLWRRLQLCRSAGDSPDRAANFDGRMADLHRRWQDLKLRIEMGSIRRTYELSLLSPG